MPSHPGLRRTWRPGLPWASMCRPPGFCRFAAVLLSARILFFVKDFPQIRIYVSPLHGFQCYYTPYPGQRCACPGLVCCAPLGLLPLRGGGLGGRCGRCGRRLPRFDIFSVSAATRHALKNLSAILGVLASWRLKIGCGRVVHPRNVMDSACRM